MTRQIAEEIFSALIDSESLQRHCLSISLVMEAYASILGEDQEEWGITGLLHDADYEKFPEDHPKIIVEKLRSMGEERIAHAISAHHTGWGQSYNNKLDRYLLAVDELTGFIVAVCWMRPTRIIGLKPSSVLKRLKSKSFAAGVDRSEIDRGLKIAGLEKNEHIQFIINTLEKNKELLGLVSNDPETINNF